jgi:hypothetical protein
LLEHVTFAGELRCVRFIHSALRHVDMSEARLHGVSFHDINEHDATLPDRPDNFAIHAELFLDAEGRLRSKLDPATGEIYRGLAKSLARSASPCIVDASLLDVLLKELGPQDRAIVMSALFEMRRGRPIWAAATPTGPLT